MPLMKASWVGHKEMVALWCSTSPARTASPMWPTCSCSTAPRSDPPSSSPSSSSPQLEHESEGGRTTPVEASRAGYLCTVQFFVFRGSDVNRSNHGICYKALNIID